MSTTQVKPKALVEEFVPFDPFHPVLKSGTPVTLVTDEQRNYLRAILDLCCSDSKFADKAYDAIVFLLNQIEVPDVDVAPVIESLAPASGVIPFAAFTLSVTGTGFVAESQIRWNGNLVSSIYVSETEVTAAMDLSAELVAADYSVSVENPVGLVSNTLTFSLTAPVLLSTSVKDNEYKGEKSQLGHELSKQVKEQEK
jgi:hypothetical protein